MFPDVTPPLASKQHSRCRNCRKHINFSALAFHLHLSHIPLQVKVLQYPSQTAPEMAGLPLNVHVSSHPCLLGKLSQLRAATANARETKALVHEISTIVGCEALAAGLTTKSGPVVCILLCFAHVVLRHVSLQLLYLLPADPCSNLLNIGQNSAGLRIYYYHHRSCYDFSRSNSAFWFGDA
jgi:hypothetical protein